MMTGKYLLCTALLTFSLATTVYGASASNTVQTISAAVSEDFDGSIELTGTKVITDEFSFKVPEVFKDSCVIVPDGENLSIYDKAAYESEEGSGLIFTIAAYEDTGYQELVGCTVLGFCGNKTYILEGAPAIDPDADEAQAEEMMKFYEGGVKSVKKSFVAFIKDE